MRLSDKTIRRLCQEGWLVSPFCERTVFGGASYGLSAAGYDVRLKEPLIIAPGEFKLASTLESIRMPAHVVGLALDKSTWGRMGLKLINPQLDPGWCGETLTLMIANLGAVFHRIPEGVGIAQLVFDFVDQPAEQPYAGKYQNAPQSAQAAILEQAAA